MFGTGTAAEAGPLSHKVVEIGDDYIAVRDDAGVTECRVPMTAVRPVDHMKSKVV